MTALAQHLWPMRFPMRVLCPAKINLHLRVGPRRADGFHPLLSWMVTVGLFDTLLLEPSTVAPGVSSSSRGTAGNAGADDAMDAVSLSCDLPDLPCDQRNLVVRIAAAFKEEASAWPHKDAAPPAHATAAVMPSEHGIATASHHHCEWPHGWPLRARLQKRIPMGAGLGGGSSDGAHVLLALNRLCRTGRSAAQLSAFAAQYGSDLSFFMFGPSGVCAGRGEIVRPIDRPVARWAVLFLPPIMMPTAEVYRRFDALGLGRDSDTMEEPDWPRWATLPSEKLLSRLVNDLETPAFAISPALASLHDLLEQTLGRTVRMSGSGSSLFTLFDEQSEARRAAQQVNAGTTRVEVVEIAPRIEDDLNA